MSLEDRVNELRGRTVKGLQHSSRLLVKLADQIDAGVDIGIDNDLKDIFRLMNNVEDVLRQVAKRNNTLRRLDFGVDDEIPDDRNTSSRRP